MRTYVALLRAVNVGGTGKLAMADLKRLCAEAGFEGVQTYIQSGNVVFRSAAAATAVKSELEHRLYQETGKVISCFIRTAAEMRAVLDANPFAKADPRLTYALFINEKPLRDNVTNVRGQVDEEIHAGKRELYVYYPAGMGKSKLVVPAATRGTARNMNTVLKLVEMCTAPMS